MNKKSWKLLFLLIIMPCVSFTKSTVNMAKIIFDNNSSKEITPYFNEYIKEKYGDDDFDELEVSGPELLEKLVLLNCCGKQPAGYFEITVVDGTSYKEDLGFEVYQTININLTTHNYSLSELREFYTLTSLAESAAQAFNSLFTFGSKVKPD